MSTKTIQATGIKVKASIKAGAINLNHNRGLKVKSGIKAGSSIVQLNHSRRLLWG